jgi:hypothetical protein
MELMKMNDPHDIDSFGIPGNYKLEANMDRSNRYGIFGDNREEPTEKIPKGSNFYVHPPNQVF